MANYKLNADKTFSPIKTNDEIHDAFEDPNRIIAKTTVGDYEVSTVFLVIDHGFKGIPVLFETMIFPDIGNNQYQDRCSSYADALLMHEKAVEWLKAQIK